MEHKKHERRQGRKAVVKTQWSKVIQVTWTIDLVPSTRISKMLSWPKHRLSISLQITEVDLLNQKIFHGQIRMEGKRILKIISIQIRISIHNPLTITILHNNRQWVLTQGKILRSARANQHLKGNMHQQLLQRKLSYFQIKKNKLLATDARKASKKYRFLVKEV